MFHHQSHQSQSDHLSNLPKSTKSDFEEYEKSVDAWRHHRMIIPFKPFSRGNFDPWLTVGDAHGWDAARLIRMGISDVTASDLTAIRLEHAKQEGLIQKYRIENAEAMSLEDKSIDFVFCKEAFHHFPRPWLGIYEMLRVARKAVLLIEPRDWIIDRGPLNVIGPIGIFKALMQWIRLKTGYAIPMQSVSNLFRLGDKPNYEEVGNYIFSLSSREVEKIALGLNLPAIGLLGLNDLYEEGLWKHQADNSNPEYRRLKEMFEKADRQTMSGIGGTSYLLVAIFIAPPTTELIENLTSIGWYIKTLNRNPYLQ